MIKRKWLCKLFTNSHNINDDYPSDTGATLDCDVVVTVGQDQATAANAWQYDRTKTPTITSVSPERGGTGGGTTLAIVGTGFRYYYILHVIYSILQA